jgi:hypothetical protein
MAEDLKETGAKDMQDWLEAELEETLDETLEAIASATSMKSPDQVGLTRLGLRSGCLGRSLPTLSTVSTQGRHPAPSMGRYYSAPSTL